MRVRRMTAYVILGETILKAYSGVTLLNTAPLEEKENKLRKEYNEYLISQLNLHS